VLIPGLNPIKEWAYAGAIITYVSAVASHLTVGDGIGTFVGPTVLLTVTAVCTRQ
jgi:DoxX-like family